MSDEQKFSIECIRIWYCMTFDEYIKVTGFSRVGGYAEGKWHDFQNNMAKALCETDQSRLNALIAFANNKISKR